MIQVHLNNTAITLCRVLDHAGTQFGIFGGYAVVSEDIDCLGAVTKEQAVQLLNSVDEFSIIPQTRQDYFAYL
ncbi:hypothetical protein jhhlp_005018 [Lomentospora prolificans]|uniref:Uncharacterized protein n=1 Tax=Lomentospora prolificans TaxID=41688 RepID=A0A2N3N850_9PEZI|nr:hypothetical protein jhhlp_005018 [Lomentospora prolificans]